MEKILVGEFWAGHCPECPGLIEMTANRSDYWECPKCHLQISTLGGVQILPEKGEGEFKLGTGNCAVDSLSLNSDLRIRYDFRK